MDSPLWQAAEYNIHYSSGDEAACSEYNAAILYRLLFGVLNVWNPKAKYTAMLETIMTAYLTNHGQMMQSLDYAAAKGASACSYSGGWGYGHAFDGDEEDPEL